jgi:hypothetical protein
MTNLPLLSLHPRSEPTREIVVRNEEDPGPLRHPLSAAVVGGVVGAAVGTAVGSVLTNLLSNLPG